MEVVGAVLRGDDDLRAVIAPVKRAAVVGGDPNALDGFFIGRDGGRASPGHAVHANAVNHNVA